MVWEERGGVWTIHRHLAPFPTSEAIFGLSISPNSDIVALGYNGGLAMTLELSTGVDLLLSIELHHL